MNVLVVDLDPTTVSLLRSKNISIFTDETVQTIHSLEQRLASGIYDACVIAMKKNGFGLSIAQALRSRGIGTPLIGIIEISDDRSWSEYRAAFLEQGGDYLLCESKPRELAASLLTVTRRMNLNTAHKLEYNYESARLVVDNLSQQVTLNDIPVVLTNRELEILHLFTKTPGRVFSRQAIISHMFSQQPESNVVASLISRVRIKLRAINPDADKFIKPMPGKGYLFQSQDAH